MGNTFHRTTLEGKMTFVAATPERAERALLLAEECAEVQKCTTKLLRFGEEAKYFTEQGESFEEEIGDILFAISLMQVNGDLDMDKVQEQFNRKCEMARLRYDHIMPEKM